MINDNFKSGFEKVAVFKTLDKGLKKVYKISDWVAKKLGKKLKPKKPIYMPAKKLSYRST